MKMLIVYYSLTGNTKKVAEYLAELLNADLLELKDNVKRKGFFNFFKAGFDALRNKKSGENIDINLEKYKKIIIGSPVWAWKPAPVINNFLETHNFNDKKIVYFATLGGSSTKKFFEILDKKYKSEYYFYIRDKYIKKNDRYKIQVDNFLDKI